MEKMVAMIKRRLLDAGENLEKKKKGTELIAV